MQEITGQKNYSSLIITLLVLVNMLNFFFLISSSFGTVFQEGFSFFDNAFNMQYELRGLIIFHEGVGMDSNVFIFFPVFLIDLAILLVFLLKNKPAKTILGLCGLGIVFHLLMLNVHIPIYYRSYEEDFLTFFSMIGRGMIGNEIWIVTYLLIIYVIFHFNDINTKLMKKNIDYISLVIIAVSFELILSFFFFSLVNGPYYVFVDGAHPNIKYSSLFLSAFKMTNPYQNILGLEGKEESYPYMWMILICYLSFIPLSMLKKKFCKIAGIVLSTISLVVLFVGAFDLLDSFMMNYVTLYEVSFGSVFSTSFYAIIALNLFAISFFFVQYIYNEKTIVQVDSNPSNIAVKNSRTEELDDIDKINKYFT